MEQMAGKARLSRTYLISLTIMAVVPALLLGYGWIADESRRFENHRAIWEQAYVDSSRQQALAAAIEREHAALSIEVDRRIAYIALLVVALLVAAGLAAQRLALYTRRGLQRFSSAFAEADRLGAPIDTAQLPFAELGQLAEDANRIIAQRTRVENALRLSEKRFQLALNAAAIHMWEVDLLRGDVVVDPRWFAQLGYAVPPFEPVAAAVWRSWLHPDDLPVAQQVFTDFRAAGKTTIALELRVCDQQGDYHWFSCRGGVVEADGEPLRALGTAAEITERKQLEQELIAARLTAEEASQAKSQFLSSISHELRTPLNGVLGYAQILLRDAAATEEQRRHLSAIESCGQHLLTLINDVLDLAKIESGRIEVREAPCDLYGLLQSVSDIIRERADSKGLSYQLELAPAVPQDVAADEVKLRQILINLLGNAVKFTASGGITLRVLTGAGGGELWFQVLDTGIGIAPGRQADIFQPFQQASRMSGGTGLGLAISRRLCEAMGGRLAVRSAVAAGSCFSVQLPLKPCPGAAERAPRRAPAQVIDIGTRPLTVMVVDDNPVNRQVLAGMLRASGIGIIEAEHGQQALERLQVQPVPLVLMDVRMPVLDGFATTRAIKRDPALRDTIVIAVSASVFPDVVEGMRAQGCDDFISKPVRVADLLALLAKHLRLPLRELPAARPAAVPATRLPAPVLDALNAAIVVGDIEAMHAALLPLRAMAPELVGLAERIGQLLDNFDIEAVAALLAPQRGLG
jgi:PAS domain S-box-containing protein